jgi:outer membrane biosynthesis protein TonB
MGRSLTVPILLALGALAATGLVACGEEDAELLPGETASEITANLDTVKLLADEGDCLGAETAAQQVSEQIEAIEGIDPKLKQALRKGASRLNEVVTECEETTAEAVEPAEVPTTEAEPEKPKKEKKPKEPKEKPKEDEGTTPPGPPAETPASPETPATPPTEEGAETPSGGVSPGSPVGEEE